LDSDSGHAFPVSNLYLLSLSLSLSLKLLTLFVEQRFRPNADSGTSRNVITGVAILCVLCGKSGTMYKAVYVRARVFPGHFQPHPGTDYRLGHSVGTRSAIFAGASENPALVVGVILLL